MNKNYFVLDSSMNFNGKDFSALADLSKCRVEYNILELKYTISATLEWFVYSWRRRIDENISIYSAICTINVDMAEINTLPLFQSKLVDIKDYDEEKFSYEVIRYINNNPLVLKAIIERYSRALGSRVYGNDSTSKVNVLYDRYCSKDLLIKVLRDRKYISENNIKDIENRITDCIMNGY